MPPKTVFISNELADYQPFIREQLKRSAPIELLNHQEANQREITENFFELFIIEQHETWLAIPLWIREQAQQKYYFQFIFISNQALPRSLTDLLEEHIFKILSKEEAKEQLAHVYEEVGERIQTHAFNNNDKDEKPAKPYIPKILGEHESIIRVNGYIEVLSKARHTPCLIRGDEGTGKKTCARMIHRANNLHDDMFFVKNCENTTRTELLADLFGVETEHETYGPARPGLLAQYDGGTLILENIEKMPMEVQNRLLLYLSERRFKPLGSKRLQQSHVRIIGITHHDLKWFVNNNKFNGDLYYHLSAFEIYLPRLRERGQDIDWYIRYFLQLFSYQFAKNVIALSPQAYRIIHQYQWPGNLKELKTVLEQSVLLSNGHQITPKELPAYLKNQNTKSQMDDLFVDEMSLKELEGHYIRKIVKKTNGNKSRAAEILKISRTTLREKLRQYEIND